jgi:phospholipid/cholesterol/gamma-HCH transport system permease protein
VGSITGIERKLSETPGWAAVETAGGIADLFVKTFKAAVKPPYTWRRDFLIESATGIRRCLVPALLSLIFFAIGAVVTTVAGILNVLGTLDRLPGGTVYGWPRETGYWVTAMVFAGCVGSAITADLGARKIRDELDAIRVLGIDPIKSLVVPRVLALTFIAPILGCIGLFTAMFSIYLVTPPMFENYTNADFFQTAGSFITASDLISALLRFIVTGLFVAVVACYKGLASKGGAEGVGRAVNECVVLCFLGLWTLNTLWNTLFLASFPQVQVLRG